MVKNKKINLYKALVIFTAIAALISGITVLGYYSFFPAKTTLKIAGYHSANKLFDTLDSNLTLFDNKCLSPLMKGTIQEEARAGISMDEKLLSVFLPSETAGEILHYVNNIAFKSQRMLDVRGRKQSQELGLSYLLNPILTARISFHENSFSFGIDELSNKTLTGQPEDLEKLSFFFPDMPKEYWEPLENIDPWIGAKIIENFVFDKKALRELTLNCATDAFNSIDKKAVSIKRGQKTEVLGKEINCQEITLSLDENIQKRLAADFISRLKSDEAFYDLTAGNLLRALDTIGENQYYSDLIYSNSLYDMLSRESFTKDLSQAEAEISNASFSDLILRIYIHGLDIVKFSLEAAQENDAQFPSYICEQQFNGPSFELALTAGKTPTEDQAEINIIRNYDSTNDLDNLKLELVFDKASQEEPVNLALSIDLSEEKSEENEIDHTFKAMFEYTGPYLPDNNKLELELNGTKVRDSNKMVTERDYKGRLSFSIPSFSADNYKLGFYYDTEAIYGEEIELPEPDEALNLKTATDEDFEGLLEETKSKIEALGRLTGAF